MEKKMKNNGWRISLDVKVKTCTRAPSFSSAKLRRRCGDGLVQRGARISGTYNVKATKGTRDLFLRSSCSIS
jgi:hypothetical protein